MTDTTKTEALRLMDALKDSIVLSMLSVPSGNQREQQHARDCMGLAFHAVSVEILRLSAVEAERDRLAERLDRAIRAAEEHFGEDAIRHKLSLFKNGRARNVFPLHMDGQWFAFQRADNDAHVGLALSCAEAEMERDRLAAECEALRAESFDAVLDNLCATLPDDGSSITIHLEHWAGSVTATDWDGDVCDEELDDGSMLSRVKSAARWLDEQQSKVAAQPAAMGGKESQGGNASRQNTGEKP